VYWDNEYGEDVPFSFEGEVEFSDVSAYFDDISTLDELQMSLYRVKKIYERK
jgi:hypothetical protein